MAQFLLFRKRQLVHQIFAHILGAPQPPPNQQSDGFPRELLLKGPQTELRALSQNREQTLPRERTNRIMNKQAFLSIGFFMFYRHVCPI